VAVTVAWPGADFHIANDGPLETAIEKFTVLLREIAGQASVQPASG